MSDITTPLVLSVVSLAGTILTTLVGAYLTYYSDERKARREADQILLKYRDPLLLAAADLQARCFGICDLDILDFKTRDKEGDDMYKDTLYIYTAYVVGQYLSWVWILRRQAQFVALVSSSPPKWTFWKRKNVVEASSLMQKIKNIEKAFSTTAWNPTEHAFMMFKADQSAIGEIMSCQDSAGEYYCMGYATFTQRWKNGAPDNLDQEGEHKGATISHKDDKTGENMAGVNKISDQAFRAHFKAIDEGLEAMYEKRCEEPSQSLSLKERNKGSDGRLRRLQHLLLDLMHHLDTAGNMINSKESSPANHAKGCDCSLGPCHCQRGCKRCTRNKKLSKGQTKPECVCVDCANKHHHGRVPTFGNGIVSRRPTGLSRSNGPDANGDIA